MKVELRINKYATIFQLENNKAYSVCDTREIVDTFDGHKRVEFLLYDETGKWKWFPAAYFIPVD